MESPWNKIKPIGTVKKPKKPSPIPNNRAQSKKTGSPPIDAILGESDRRIQDIAKKLKKR